MTKILFNRSEKAFLPEIDAYIKYFNMKDGFRAYDSSKIEHEYHINDFDVIWEFKGFGGLKVQNQMLIHEYASLSLGSFPLLKNNLKTKFNPKPNLRIFLNENVKSGYKFNDNIDYCYRDMGIDESFLQIESTKKDYDYVYVGPISKIREIDKLLANFSKKANGILCLIGNVDDDIYKTYKSNKDIIFTGKVPYSEVPEIASRAIYGINYIPDKYPFNIQTSTKLLEYLALGLKIITTDYKWIRQFEEKNKCSFYKLNNSFSDFDLTNLDKYPFISQFNAEEYLWNSIIDRANIIEKIRFFR